LNSLSVDNDNEDLYWFSTPKDSTNTSMYKADYSGIVDNKAIIIATSLTNPTSIKYIDENIYYVASNNLNYFDTNKLSTIKVSALTNPTGFTFIKDYIYVVDGDKGIYVVAKGKNSESNIIPVALDVGTGVKINAITSYRAGAFLLNFSMIVVTVLFAGLYLF